MNVLQTPLNNVQVELLDTFSLPLPDDSLVELKQLLLQFKFDQLEKLANEEWENKNLNSIDIEKRLNAHHRTTYKSQERYLKISKENS